MIIDLQIISIWLYIPDIGIYASRIQNLYWYMVNNFADLTVKVISPIILIVPKLSKAFIVPSSGFLAQNIIKSSLPLIELPDL